jgi:hypothetical protein
MGWPRQFIRKMSQTVITRTGKLILGETEGSCELRKGDVSTFQMRSLKVSSFKTSSPQFGSLQMCLRKVSSVEMNIPKQWHLRDAPR